MKSGKELANEGSNKLTHTTRDRQTSWLLRAPPNSQSRQWGPSVTVPQWASQLASQLTSQFNSIQLLTLHNPTVRLFHLNSTSIPPARTSAGYPPYTTPFQHHYTHSTSFRSRFIHRHRSVFHSDPSTRPSIPIPPTTTTTTANCHKGDDALPPPPIRSNPVQSHSIRSNPLKADVIAIIHIHSDPVQNRSGDG